MKIRRLTSEGRERYQEWLSSRSDGELPPAELLQESQFTELAFDIDIDASKKFETRFEFGKYIVDLLEKEDEKVLLSPRSDGIWDWITIAYFEQIGRKVSKPHFYSVTRKGHKGSLAYRHLARTAFEMAWRHGEASFVMLHVDMSTWGDLAEQLTSRQNVAYHRGYFNVACALYMPDGKLRRGAAGRVRPLKKRKPGETAGRGGAGRLALAVRRLSRTFDTHVVGTADMLELLPKEFSRFAKKAVQAQA